MTKYSYMKRYLIEAVGTFFLVLSVALTRDPLAIGITLAVLVYIGASVSGAHYNPAVSFALYLQKKMNWKETIRYFSAQLIGAGFAAIVSQILFNTPIIVQPNATVTWTTAFVAEVLFTALLVFVIFAVAVYKKTQPNQYYGAAIGLTVFAGASAVGHISGGAFNPAVGIVPLILNTLMGAAAFDPSVFFLYILGPIVGAALGWAMYKYILE